MPRHPIDQQVIDRVTALTGGSKMRRFARAAALDAASRAISPHLQGVYGWLVRPRVGESLTAYARRARLCAAARSVEAGLGCPRALDPSAKTEVVAMACAYGAPRSAVAVVSELERAVATGGSL